MKKKQKSLNTYNNEQLVTFLNGFIEKDQFIFT